MDPDDNLDSCYLTEGVGIYAAGQICFTPDSSGLYTFVLRSVDDCGAFDEDTVEVDVTINTPPVCDVAGDTSYFQCSPTQVSRRVTASDIDGNFDHCEIITGPGSIIDSFWVYTPTTDQSVSVRLSDYLKVDHGSSPATSRTSFMAKLFHIRMIGK